MRRRDRCDEDSVDMLRKLCDRYLFNVESSNLSLAYACSSRIVPGTSVKTKLQGLELSEEDLGQAGHGFPQWCDPETLVQKRSGSFQTAK